MTVNLSKPRFTTVSLHKPRHRRGPAGKSAWVSRSACADSSECLYLSVVSETLCPRHNPIGYALWGAKRRAA